MKNYEPDSYGWEREPDPSPIELETVGAVTFSLRTYVSVLFVAACFLTLGLILYFYG